MLRGSFSVEPYSLCHGSAVELEDEEGCVMLSP